MSFYTAGFSLYVIIFAIIIPLLILVLFIWIGWLLLKNAIKRGVEQGIYNAFNKLRRDGHTESAIAEFYYCKSKYEKKYDVTGTNYHPENTKTN